MLQKAAFQSVYQKMELVKCISGHSSWHYKHTNIVN